MELVAYLHGEILSELVQQGESIDQNLDCKLIGSIGGSLANSSHHAKSLLCMGLVAGTLAMNMPTAAFAYSADVASIQELLARRGFNAGAIDGVKGAATTEAIIAAQTFYGLEADGVVGAATLAALEADTYEANPDTMPLANTSDSSSDTASSVTVTSSAATKNLQQLLSDRGFYGGEIDGIYGAMTEEAVLIAQRKYGLIADGVAGSLTIAALEADQGNAITPVSYVTVTEKDASTANSTITSSEGVVASGDAIAQAQTLMSELGFYDGAIDGIQGEMTTAAVKKAQAFYGITVDGVIGSQTLAALQS